MIDRRLWLAAILAIGVPLTPLDAHAQRAKMPRVGVLAPGYPPPGDPIRQREAFEGGLRDLGWIPGSNILIEYRYAEGKGERLQEQAGELARLPVDIFVARSPAAIAAAKRASGSIPIVMSASPDPIREGFVASLARPGANITGLTLQAADLDAKQLQMLGEAMPKLRRVGILRNAASGVPGAYEEPRRLMEAAAHALRLELLDFPISRPEEIAPAFAAMRQADVGAVLVRSDPFILDPRQKEIVALVLKHKLPSIHFWRSFVEAGSFMSYGANIFDIHRRSATYVDRILKGAKPGDLPVEQPTKFELVINVKTAKAFGLTIPEPILFRADRVIE